MYFESAKKAWTTLRDKLTVEKYSSETETNTDIFDLASEEFKKEKHLDLSFNERLIKLRLFL
jgi:hypothetical protein